MMMMMVMIQKSKISHRTRFCGFRPWTCPHFFEIVSAATDRLFSAEWPREKMDDMSWRHHHFLFTAEDYESFMRASTSANRPELRVLCIRQTIWQPKVHGVNHTQTATASCLAPAPEMMKMCLYFTSMAERELTENSRGHFIIQPPYSTIIRLRHKNKNREMPLKELTTFPTSWPQEEQSLSSHSFMQWNDNITANRSVFVFAAIVATIHPNELSRCSHWPNKGTTHDICCFIEQAWRWRTESATEISEILKYNNHVRCLSVLSADLQLKCRCTIRVSSMQYETKSVHAMYRISKGRWKTWVSAL